MLSPHPLCCPARAEILTGQYAHNNGVRSNAERFHGGWTFLDLGPHDRHLAAHGRLPDGVRRQVPQRLHRGPVEGAEPGWDIWNPLINTSTSYFGYTQYENGTPRT